MIHFFVYWNSFKNVALLQEKPSDAKWFCFRLFSVLLLTGIVLISLYVDIYLIFYLMKRFGKSLYYLISFSLGWQSINIYIRQFLPRDQHNDFWLCLIQLCNKFLHICTFRFNHHYFFDLGKKAKILGSFFSATGENWFIIVDHSFSTNAKFSKKLIFLTLWYAHVLVRIRG